MRHLCLLFCAMLLLAWNHQIKAATFIQQDTLQQDTICITPYFAKTSVRSLGNFSVIKKDRYAFQTNAGFSVLNTLRGHVPNLNIGPNAASAGTGLRSTESMLVIDGLPYADVFHWNYNLNAFDYENVYALSSGNAAILYGGLAGNGAVFLQSKTGKNVFKPSVEFNSSPSYLLWDDATSSSVNTELLQFTNAIAYAQDYGAADLRVSYNGTYTPEAGSGPKMNRGLNNIRINTGVDIADRLNARLILDGMTSNMTGQSDIPLPYTSEESADNLQGNLMLRYQATDWLTITSQSSLAGMDRKSNNTFDGGATNWTDENRRSLVNLFASASQPLDKNFSLREFAGVQYDRHKLFKKQEQFSGIGGSQSIQQAERKTRSLLAGIGLQYNNCWFADLNYRRDQFSVSEEGSQPTYALTSAFIFSEAFQWQNEWFSSGKLRGSYGKTIVAPEQGYPGTMGLLTISGGTGGIIMNPDMSVLVEKKMVEAGADLSFFDRKLDLSLSYFHDLDDQYLMLVLIPTGTGFSYTYANIGKKNLKGWEAVLAVNPLRSNDLSLHTALTWSAPRNYIEPGALEINMESYDSTPDWAGSLLNQLTVGRFFGAFLVDVRKGGEARATGSNPEVTTYDGTNVKLRDLSIGYRWPETLLVRTKISLSARNLWNLYAKDEEFEARSLVMPQKSISLSATVSF
jgi:hypothetical protein